MTDAPAPPPGDGAPAGTGGAIGNAPPNDGSVWNGSGGEIQATTSDPAVLKAARHKALEKLGLWFVFAVIFAVLPTVARFLQGLTQRGHQNPGLYELASRADLYIVCMGLTATAIGQALMRTEGKMPRALKLWSVFNIVVLALVTFLAAGTDTSGVDQVALGQQSLILLGATLISTGWTTYLCELEVSS